MLEVRRGLDLAEEPLGPDHGGEFGAKDLERDLPVVLQVVREVHGGHAAGAEFPLDTVSTFECGVQVREHRVIWAATSL